MERKRVAVPLLSHIIVTYALGGSEIIPELVKIKSLCPWTLFWCGILIVVCPDYSLFKYLPVI